MTDTPVFLSIGQLAAKADCSVETIHFYEKKGLMPQVPRSAGGHRLFRQQDLKRLQFIRHCRRLGFSTQQMVKSRPWPCSRPGRCRKNWMICAVYRMPCLKRPGDARAVTTQLTTAPLSKPCMPANGPSIAYPGFLPKSGQGYLTGQRWPAPLGAGKSGERQCDQADSNNHRAIRVNTTLARTFMRV